MERDLLVVAGLGLLAMGGLLLLLAWLGTGPLTGIFRLGGVTVVVPVGLSLLLSLALTVLVNLWLRMR
ncbi:MAG TPA: DUF2905 family protein [Candidatus Dormibacteraeota bacterium]|jgi:hypothetical protein|nr:DUF2905 family protein [Candidatus Dormibacteraeota bacterium]